MSRAVRLLRRLAWLSFLGFFISFGLGSAPVHDDFNLLDFGSFVAAGRAATTGLNPYDLHPLNARVSFAGEELAFRSLNPPIATLGFEVLAALDPSAAFRAWYVISLGLYALVVALLRRAHPEHVTPPRIFWAFGMAGLWYTLVNGQIYTLLLLCSAGAWLLLGRQRHGLAGVLLGLLVAIKPNVLLWPVFLFLAGYRRAALMACAVAGALSLLPLPVFGYRIYLQWLEALETGVWITAPANASLPAFAARLGLPWLGTMAGAAVLVAVAVWAWRCRPSALSISSLALVAMLVALPLSWVGYTILLLPVFLSRAWPPLLCAAAMLLLVPDPVVWTLSQQSLQAFVVVGSIYSTATLLLLLAMVQAAWKVRRQQYEVPGQVVAAGAGAVP